MNFVKWHREMGQARPACEAYQKVRAEYQRQEDQYRQHVDHYLVEKDQYDQDRANYDPADGSPRSKKNFDTLQNQYSKLSQEKQDLRKANEGLHGGYEKLANMRRNWRRRVSLAC